MNQQPTEDDRKNAFAEGVNERRSSIVSEFLYFLRENKNWWLTPILIVLGLVALLAIFGSSGAAPFIYTLF